MIIRVSAVRIRPPLPKISSSNQSADQNKLATRGAKSCCMCYQEKPSVFNGCHPLSEITCNADATRVRLLFNELHRDRRHGRGVGFASLEQITVAIEGLRDRRMAHERLNAFRAEALFDPQRSAGMAQSMQ